MFSNTAPAHFTLSETLNKTIYRGIVEVFCCRNTLFLKYNKSSNNYRHPLVSDEEVFLEFNETTRFSVRLQSV